MPAGNAPGTLDGSGDPYWSPTGNYLPREIAQKCLLSISQAQRVAKIIMLRTRQQGSGTLVMSAAALQLQPVDVIEFNLPALSWTNKLLEVAGNTGQKFKIRFAEPPGAEGGDSAPALFVEVPVNETDPSVYEWDPYFEELNPYDIPAVGGGVGRYIVAPPTSVVATSDLSTGLVQPNGTVIPRIELTWTEPADVFVQTGGSIEIQMCAHSSAAWQDVLLLGGQSTVAFLGNVVSGNSYDLRIRSVRSTGATSVWVEIDNVVCGFALGATGLNPVATSGTLIAITTSLTASEIVVDPFTATAPGYSVSCLPGGAVNLTGLTPQNFYYVYYIDPTFAGGAITPIATLNAADFENKPGYFLIGAILTPPYGTTRYAPTAGYNSGSVMPLNLANAFDNNIASYASVFVNYSYFAGQYAEALFETFPSVLASGSNQLYVDAAVVVAASGNAPWAITAAVGGATKPLSSLGTLNPRGAWAATTSYAVWDTFTESGVTYLVVGAYTSGSSFGSTDIVKTCVLLASGSGAASRQTYSVLLPSGFNLDDILVDVTVNPEVSGAGNQTTVQVFEIYVQ